MDEMIDLMAGDAMLRRRLEAYAESRLTPDLTVSSRIRARVLAVAHRHADLARADSALSIVPPASGFAGVGRRSARRIGATHPARSALRRPVAALLAASLGTSIVTGTALAARPGGALYDARLWVETLTLPTDPSERAVAELGRLEARLIEAGEAARSSDAAGVAAALSAYERIMAEASAAAISAHDEVAEAVLETGVGRNLKVLRVIAGRVPTQAGDPIDRALDRAMERSSQAIDIIETSKPDRPGDGGGGGGPRPTDATPKPTTAPAPTPAIKPTQAPGGPVAAPTKEPSKPDKPDPTPHKTPPGQRPD